jgi:hypothetical protein
MSQLINQPKLRHVLHPGADERYELSRNEELKIAVLHRAKARGTGREARGLGWIDRGAVIHQNIFLHSLDAKTVN